ncbi:response regulator transcription factor [Corynebacterium cystitidis]|uniref:response regulator transcription factor n=1 Tax=Corynebacterium cystitidis TaxID=35757 RepID=UPI00211F2640|nr:LuxR C-terminal-related transcriptional regulator [Corynebacterium cystitidis]
MHLSERQREVLELYAMGESAKRVAALTELSVDTVQDYLQRIRTKYALQGRATVTKVDLMQRAQEDGYLPGPWET